MIPGLFLGAVLLGGAGCSNTKPVSPTPIPVEKPSTKPIPTTSNPAQAVSCTKVKSMTFLSSKDLLKHDILVEEEKIGTVETEGPMDVDGLLTFPGASFFLFQYNGIGGYIPFRSYPFFYAVDTCSNTLRKISPPPGTNSVLHTVSPDGSMVVYTNRKTIGILPSGIGVVPETIATTWTLPDAPEDVLIGDFFFSPKNETLVAFTTVVGPENEHSAIYTLDLKTGVFETIATKTSGILQIKGWTEDSNEVYYE